MVKKDFNGVQIGASAVAFFDKLAMLESGNNYKMDKNKSFKGRYQIGIDVLIDLGCATNGMTWENISFKGELAKKYKLTNKESFLNNPIAQDEIMMLSIKKRWQSLKAYSNLICQYFKIPTEAEHKKPNQQTAPESSVLVKLNQKKVDGYNGNNMRGKSIKITSSGLLVAGHLVGQGAVGNALKNNCKGKYGIPCDGNLIPFYFYHENMSGHDLSVIIGFKDPCVNSNVVLKNDSSKDKKEINNKVNESKTSENMQVKQNTEEKLTELKKIETKKIGEKKEKGVYEFTGQKYDEVSDTELYKKDREEISKDPKIVFVQADEAILERLKEKFNDKNLYNKNYIKYVENKTKRKIFEENKNDIEHILKIYDEKTKNNEKSGNVINQVNFDMLRGREATEKKIRIDDIIYYIYCNPIINKSKIESLEEVLSQYSAKYVLYPDKKSINSVEKDKSYLIKNVPNILEGNKKLDNKIEKNELPEIYNKYMKGIKDIDEIEIKIEKVEKNKINETSSFKLINKICESDEYKKAYEKDEKGIYKYPIVRRLLDNIYIEFLKVQSNFKTENEEKYFDNHKYKDSNIVRNYLLWYIKRYKGLIISSEDSDNMYNRLSSLNENIRVTTVLKSWIESKSAIKVENIRRISKNITEVYEKYRDRVDEEKDKKIIHNLFKTQKDLRNYVANIDAMDIYSFYVKFYNLSNIINPEKTMYVNNKCILKCTMTNDISKIIASEKGVTLEGGTQLNIGDSTIQPFKMCKAIKYCKPELEALWEKHTEVEIRGKPALLDIATIKCAHGGVISIDNPGQNKVGIATGEINKNVESKRDVDCTYKLMENIISEINNIFMQTQLKSECVKFAKDKKEYEKLKKEISIKEINDIKRGIYTEEMKKTLDKNALEKIKNKINKIEKLKEERVYEKEKELKEKIFEIFIESYKKIKNISNPEFDSKGIVKKYGMSMCDHNNQSFYNSKILSIIVFGYLTRAAELKKSKKEIKKIEEILNEEEKESGVAEEILDEKYNILEKLKNEVEKIEKIKIIETEIEKWINIGENLYSKLKNVPTTSDIMTSIKENGEIVAKCPFSLVEWNKVHLENLIETKNNEIKKNEIKQSSPQTNKNDTKNGNSVSESKIKVQQTSTKNTITPKEQSHTDKTIETKTNIQSNTTKVNNCPNCKVESRAPWMKYVLEEYNRYKGMYENTDPLATKIREYHKVGAKNSTYGPSVPWCASFVNWILKKANQKNWESARSLGAMSSSEMKKIKTPVFGAIIVLRNYTYYGNQASGLGHVTFLYGMTKDKQKYLGLGGNQSNQLKLSSFSIYKPGKKFQIAGVYYVQKFEGLYLPKNYEIKESDKLTEKDYYEDSLVKMETTTR